MCLLKYARIPLASRYPELEHPGHRSLLQKSSPSFADLKVNWPSTRLDDLGVSEVHGCPIYQKQNQTDKSAENFPLTGMAFLLVGFDNNRLYQNCKLYCSSWHVDFWVSYPLPLFASLEI